MKNCRRGVGRPIASAPLVLDPVLRNLDNDFAPVRSDDLGDAVGKARGSEHDWIVAVATSAGIARSPVRAPDRRGPRADHLATLDLSDSI
jgi:hypothetical protein